MLATPTPTCAATGDLIQRTQKRSPNTVPEDDGLVDHSARGRPAHLVAVLPPQEVEPTKATFDGAANHHSHHHRAYTLGLPLGIPTALIEKHGISTREAAPRSGGLAVQIQTREPQLTTRRETLEEMAKQPFTRVAQCAATMPARFVQRLQMRPPLVEALRCVIHQSRSMLPHDITLAAPHALTS